MIEFFANSLFTGFSASSGIGKGIVYVQLLSSLVMFTYIFGKYRELTGLTKASLLAVREVLGGRNVLSCYLQRKSNVYHQDGSSPVDAIYMRTCERLVARLTNEVRSQLSADLVATGRGLSLHNFELVKSMAEQVFEEESDRAEKGMGVIATVVALAPMLGLLGTVWGVLDAFDSMGTAGTATIATMAPAISSALVTTVAGLCVAIPGVAAHNALSAKLRTLTAKWEGFLDDFIGCIGRDFEENGRSV